MSLLIIIRAKYKTHKITFGSIRKGEILMIVKVGDYFDVYRDGDRTRRVIAISNSYESRYGNNVIDAMTIDPVQYYLVHIDNEVESVLGNIFD